MKFDIYQLTSIGDRKSNQDYMAYHLDDKYSLFVVADGLGGYQAGKRASGYFCKGLLAVADTFTPLLEQCTDTEVNQVFIAWVDAAIEEMEKMFAGDSVANEAHTTCVILYVDDEKTVTAHCGDSRVYRMREGKVLWRTKDHSVPQRLFDIGRIGELEMGYHPGQNKLTKSINIKNNHSIEINIYAPAVSGETFVLCTDGFWSSIKEYELLHLALPDCDKADIIKQAKTAYLRAEGKSDNLTVQWVRVL